MLLLAGVLSSSLLLQPLAPSRPARSFARTPPLVTASILERTRSGTLTEVQPGERYRADDQPAKYYSGPNPANKAALQKMKKDIGKRKLVVITGASSGLGLFCFEALLANQVVCVDRHTPPSVLPRRCTAMRCAAHVSRVAREGGWVACAMCAACEACAQRDPQCRCRVAE